MVWCTPLHSTNHRAQIKESEASELEEALALLDEAPWSLTGLEQTDSEALAEWEPELQWGILDHDSGDLAVSVLTDPEPGTAHQVPTKKRKKANSNKARDERRFQLVELQEQVDQLQFTLQRLQTIRSKRPKSRERSGFETEHGVPPVWREICGRQLERRLEAERENVRLTQQLQREKQLAHSFEKLLNRRRVAEPEATKRTRRTDIPAGYIERMAALIYQELAAGVEVCYRKVESVFGSKRCAPVAVIRHSSLLDGGVKGAERRFFDQRTMPFDMRSTGDAWWENWHNYRGQRFQDIAANEITESFGLEMSDCSTSATAYAQQISRRHVEDDRVVFVWDAYVEPFGFGNERVGGVYLLEQNYVLVRPEDWSCERVHGGTAGCFTRVSTCYVLTPHFLDPTLKEDPQTLALINFLVSAMSSNIMALSEMVETVLLDQALQKWSK